MRILHLVLFSETDPEYKCMYYHTRNWYAQCKDVETYYYTFDENATEITIDADTNIMRVPGKNSFMPGILQKTIQAFAYGLNHKDFDYCVRSNVSTVVNFPNLFHHLKATPFLYGGTHVMTQTIETKSDAIPHGPVQFAQGTCIVLSHDSLRLIVQQRDSLCQEVADDVSIALFLKQQHIIPQTIGTQYIGFQSSYNIDGVTAFRNHSSNRKDDSTNVRSIVNVLWQRYVSMTKHRVVKRVFYYNCDVTDKIIDMCTQNQVWCTKQDNATLDTLFHDPCPGVAKTLHIEFQNSKLPAFTQCASLSFSLHQNNLVVM